MQLTVTSVVTSLVSGMTLWNFSAKYFILFRLDFRMLLKQGTRNGERARERGEEKREQSLTGTQTLSVTSFPTLCFRFSPFFIFPFPVLISRSPFLVLVTSLDSDRSFGPPVRGRSAGSFSEQRLVIEPIFFSAVSKTQYHFYLLP